MKQIFVVFTFLFSCSCFAQFSAGVKAGAILSNFRFENTSNEKNAFKPSFYLGGFAEYKIGKLSPEIELSYMQSGDNGRFITDKSVGENQISAESKYQLNLLSLIVTAKYYLLEKFNVKAGWYYGRILEVKNNLKNISNQDDNFETNLKDEWNKSDYGFTFGLNYDISTNLFLESNYFFGLTDLRGMENFEVKNRMIRLGIGYKF